METLKEAFNGKYPAYSKRILGKFEKVNKCEATWENMTKPNIDKFIKSLQKEVARSSARTYGAMFKSVLNLYSEEIDLPRGFNEILTVKKDVSQNIYLTDEEVQKIIDYEPESDTERVIRNQFILGCLTGARHSDYIMFTRENIFGKNLKYVSKKTHIEAEIPLSPAVKRVIMENETYGFVGLEYSLTYFNQAIKNICQKVDITENMKLYQGGEYVTSEKWSFASSHTARRSFATNLYLRGADLYLISRLMGHTSVEQSKNYICANIENLSQEVTNFFSNFN